MPGTADNATTILVWRGICIVMTQHDLPAALLAPDFYHYSPAPIAAVTREMTRWLSVGLMAVS